MELAAGVNVEVPDDGLAALRQICPDMPPNHHGRVVEIKGDLIMVEFPIGGDYSHSQIAPYPRAKVRIRKQETQK